MKLKHIHELDGIRALAALMIMFFHFFQDYGTGNVWINVMKKYSIFGQTGVSLFFVLSGFLITRILINSKNSTSYFKNFYIRRALRIFPLYYLFLVIYFFVFPAVIKLPIESFGQQIYYWIYLQNIAMTFNWPNSGPGHFWSLSIEEQFYLFWPLVIFFLPINKLKIAIYLLIGIALLTRIYFISIKLNVFYFTITRMDELSMGALLAVWELEGILTKKNANKFVQVLMALLIPTLILWINTTGKGWGFVQIIKINLISLVYVSFIGWIICLEENNGISQILRVKFLKFTGKISYGLYVFHPLCFLIIFKYLNMSISIAFFLCFTFTYIVAYLSYTFYESYFINLKKKFI